MTQQWCSTVPQYSPIVLYSTSFQPRISQDRGQAVVASCHCQAPGASLHHPSPAALTPHPFLLEIRRHQCRVWHHVTLAVVALTAPSPSPPRSVASTWLPTLAPSICVSKPSSSAGSSSSPTCSAASSKVRFITEPTIFAFRKRPQCSPRQNPRRLLLARGRPGLPNPSPIPPAGVAQVSMHASTSASAGHT